MTATPEQSSATTRALEMAHVLFMDIVAYSKLPMEEQTALLKQLQTIVRETTEFRVAQEKDQLLPLPTGDGMALVFFGDPEAAVRCAIEISHALTAHPNLKLRMGVHTGPVFRVQDINAARNVAGGGINLAQRVMDCGDAGHILVSGAMADVLSHVSRWKTTLHDLGEVKVKHGLGVRIFNLYTADAGNSQTPQKLHAAKTRKTIRKSEIVVGILLLVIAIAGLVWWFFRPPPEPAVKHIAVLPFRLNGASPEDAALFEGLTDTVTNRLMQLTASQQVGIIPFNEINASHVTNMQQARSKLGANLALDGNLQRNGDTLQVNLALADIESHKQLRADSVTGTATDFKQFEEKVVDTAVAMLELELHKNPPPDEAHGTTSREAYNAFTRGRGYLSRPSTPENVESAISQLVRALELDPGYAAAFAFLGRSYWGEYELTKDQKWIPKVRDACEHSQKLAPSAAGANICLGMLEAGTGQYQDAASHFQLALDADPTNDIAYRQLGNAYEQLGRLELAERTYQKAIQVHPENASDYTWLGGLYNREAQYANAAAQFEHAVRLAPDDAGDWLGLGGTYLHAGFYPQAEKALQRAISLQPSYDAYSNLGMAYFLERKFPDAIAAFEQSSALGGRQIMAYGNLAQAYYWYPPTRIKAKAALKKAIELAEADLRVNPIDADAHTLVAEYFAMVDDKKQALEHLQTALRLRPGDPETAYFAAKVYNLLGDRERALNWLEKSVNSGYSPAEISNTIELDSLRKEPRFQALSGKLHS